MVAEEHGEVRQVVEGDVACSVGDLIIEHGARLMADGVASPADDYLERLGNVGIVATEGHVVIAAGDVNGSSAAVVGLKQLVDCHINGAASSC